jgi:hypothetical protein
MALPDDRWHTLADHTKDAVGHKVVAGLAMWTDRNHPGWRVLVGSGTGGDHEAAFVVVLGGVLEEARHALASAPVRLRQGDPTAPRSAPRYPAANFSEIHCDDGTLFSSQYGTRRPENVFADKSPVYAIVDGKPIRIWDDAQ